MPDIGRPPLRYSAPSFIRLKKPVRTEPHSPASQRFRSSCCELTRESRMHPIDLPSHPGVVRPGAIGHSRAIVGRNFAFIPPEGVLKSRLPAWSATTVRFLAAPSLGADFAQFMLEIEPSGGTAQPICVDLQHFFYVVTG